MRKTSLVMVMVAVFGLATSAVADWATATAAARAGGARALPPDLPSAKLSRQPGTDNTGGPDGDGYVWTDTIAYAWDANTGYTMSGYGDDGYFGPFTWSGWSFFYRGTNYSQIYISENGYITFGSNTPYGGYGTTYPSSSNGTTACGLLHGDLYSSGGRAA